MAKVKGPLFSLEASGSVAKTVVYSKWKGRQYVRQHTIPLNPQSEKQVNVRTAMTLLVAYWQTLADPVKALYIAEGKQFNYSGFNYFTKKGMLEYVEQITVDVTPVSVTVSGNPPTEVWVWT